MTMTMTLSLCLQVSIFYTRNTQKQLKSFRDACVPGAFDDQQLVSYTEARACYMGEKNVGGDTGSRLDVDGCLFSLNGFAEQASKKEEKGNCK